MCNHSCIRQELACYSGQLLTWYSQSYWMALLVLLGKIVIEFERDIGVGCTAGVEGRAEGLQSQRGS